MPTTEMTRGELEFVEPRTVSTIDQTPDRHDKERLSSIRVSVPRPASVCRTVQINSRGIVVSFNWSDSGDPRPRWFLPVLQGFANLVTFPQLGWSGCLKDRHRDDEPSANGHRAVTGIRRPGSEHCSAIQLWPLLVPILNALTIAGFVPGRVRWTRAGDIPIHRRGRYADVARLGNLLMTTGGVVSRSLLSKTTFRRS